MHKSVALIILLSIVLWPLGVSAQPTLQVYGPAAPAPPLKECADIFYRETGILVKITGGLERDWISRARLNADLIYAGSEFMMSNFMIRRPGFIAESTRTSLYPRAVGILIRAGNPKKIFSLEDLARPGIRLIEAVETSQVGLWEDVAGLRGLIADIRRNTVLSTRTTVEAMDRFRHTIGIDAWITFESQYHLMNDIAELIILPDDLRLSRGTPIAVTSFSHNRQSAMRFLEFLKSDEAHVVFQSWGWK